MKIVVRFLLVAVVAVAAVVALWWFVLRPNGLGDGQIRVSGNVETNEVQAAFKIPGRVLKRDVDEGETIKAGQLIATLETNDLQATIDLRKAELGVAQAALAVLKAGSRRQEIETALANWEKAAHTRADLEAGSRPQEIAVAEAAQTSADAEMRYREATFRRDEILFQKKTISAEDFDASKTAKEVAVEKYRQAVEQLKLSREGFRKERIEEARSAEAAAKWQYDLVKEGPRKEDIAQAEARVRQAEAALHQAEVQLGYATLISQTDGVVLSKNIEPGDYVAAGTPVVTIGDMQNVWLRAYIDEGDLGKVKRGQRAWVTTDTFTGKTRDRYEGVVGFISEVAEFTPKSVQTQKERVKLVYRIKINIVNRNGELKPGMPADAVIDRN